MAIATGPLNRDASLPTLGPVAEWLSGSATRAVAAQRARVRQEFVRNSVTHFWHEVIEIEMRDSMTLADDDIRIAVVTGEDRAAVDSAARLAELITFVHVPTPDD